MKTFFFLSIVLLLNFTFQKQTKTNFTDLNKDVKSKPHCLTPLMFGQSVQDETKKVDNEIDQSWYGKVMDNIQNEEYNISYNDKLRQYQSPNRVNNIRFIYHNDGFTAKTRNNKIPLFNVSDKTIKEEEKKYKIISEWDIRFRMSNVKRETSNVNLDKGQSTMFNIQFADFSKSEINVNKGNAFIENDNMRIDYTNDEKGMRQDFTIKNKLDGEGTLRLNLSADTKLKMIVSADALSFKDRNGNEKMKYSALKSWDVNGKELRAYFESPLSNEKLKIENGKLNLKIRNQKSQIPIRCEAVPSGKSQIPNCKNLKSKIKNLKSFSIVVNDEEAIYPITIDPLSTSPDWTAESDQDGAYFGSSVSTAGDVNGDGYSDVIVGAPRYDNGQTDEGSAFAYYGSATGLSLTPNWITESNQESALFGYSVSTAGDVNGDGYSDVIVVVGYHFPPTRTAYAYYGSAAGLSTTAKWAESNIPYDNFGSSVSTAGDVNGDGYSDVIVGFIRFHFVGEVDVYYGSATGLSSTANWTGEDPGSTGEDLGFGTSFGNSVSTAGDVNGDGYSDVIVGAPGYGEFDEGGAFGYYGSATGLSVTSNWTAEGNQLGANFGYSVSTAGDVNGDGYSDVIVGAPHNDNYPTPVEGTAYAYYGSATGLSSTANWAVERNQAGALFGNSVSTAGDVNGDGYSDVIVGAPYYNGQTNGGRAFCYFGSTTGLSLTPNWTAESNQANAYFGVSVSTAGDVNGDGYYDVIVGANAFDNDQTNEGRAFAYYGGPVKVLNLTVFIQGFYRASLNSTIQDTVKVYLRSVSIPYPIIDSAKTYLDILGTGVFAFNNAFHSVNYYFVVKHRNSIETWSAAGISFSNNYLTYNFSTSLTQAYGNNMIQADNSPLRFAIFSGDVNQDGFVNLTDMINVNNDGTNFITGYVPSDINGDNSVNLADLLITYNNSSAFVSIKRP